MKTTVTRKPGKKPRKYERFVCEWDAERGWWNIKSSIPRGITCGILKPDQGVEHPPA